MSVLQREALDALSVPDWVDLTEPQARGAACVWCETPLSGGAVVDLGTRRVELSDGTISVFPRACVPCLKAAPENHVQICDLCSENADAHVNNGDVCDTARTLRRLVLEHVR